MKTSKLKLTITSTALATLFVLAIPFAQAEEWTGNIGGYLGSKVINHDDWQEFDQPYSVGLIVDFKQKSRPVSIAVDSLITADVNKSGAQENVGYSIEKHLGIRKIFIQADSSFKPYIGGGIAFIRAGIERKNPTTTIKR